MSGMRVIALSVLGLNLLLSDVALADDLPFPYAVCALLDRPFSGSITDGGGTGCTWRISREDGDTMEEEELQALASRDMKDDEIKTIRQTWLDMFKESVKSGGGKLEPLPICDGGWVVTNTIPKFPPSKLGFYICGNSFIQMSASGALSVGQFDKIGQGLVDLLKLP